MIKSHKEVTKQYESRFFLLFLLDDEGSGVGSGSVPLTNGGNIRIHCQILLLLKINLLLYFQSRMTYFSLKHLNEVLAVFNCSIFEQFYEFYEATTFYKSLFIDKQF
jgi:hypothetical protein